MNEAAEPTFMINNPPLTEPSGDAAPRLEGSG